MQRELIRTLGLCLLLAFASCGGDAKLIVSNDTPTPTPIAEPSDTPTRGSTATATATSVPSATSTAPSQATSTSTATPQRTPTASATITIRVTRTSGATASATSPRASTTPTRTGTTTPTSTQNATATSTFTTTPTPTASLTSTVSPTFSPSPTFTQTPTSSATFTVGTPATPTNTVPTATSTRTPTSTPTPTITNTRAETPTSTATPTRAGNCGDGVLTEGETCEGCPQDCTVRTCTDSGSDSIFRIDFAPPANETATSVTFLVGYNNQRLSLPGSGITAAIQQKILNRQSGGSYTGNDLDYALRVVVQRNAGLAAGRAFTVTFDACQGATPSLADLGCNIEGCAGEFGLIQGCRCTVTNP
jgi:hypothetical protein